jgi:hypothetical protein
MFRRGWQQADATVIVARHFVSTAGDLAGLDSKSELVIEVHPADGDAFRAETKISYLGFNLEQRRMSPPEVGETIRVEYDSKRHDVKVLLDETHNRKTIRDEKAKTFRAALDAPVGTVDRVIEAAPRIFVQSDGEEPVEVTSHPMDPAVGGAAGIRANGVPCRATVLAVIPLTGQKTSAGEDATGLVLSVTIDGQAPFQAQTGMYVPPAAMPRLAAGVELVGKAIAGNNDAVVVDWNAFMNGSD